MRTILIEDNPQVTALIKSLLSVHCPEVVIVGEADSVSEGYLLLSNTPADLWLLDIELRDGTVFELLDRLNPSLFDQTALVFLTAFGTFDYVIQALHKSAVDYLLKPVDPNQLKAAVQKAQKEVLGKNLSLRLEELKSLLPPGTTPSTPLEKVPIIIAKGAIRYMSLKDILFLEGDGAVCYVHTVSEKPFPSYQNLGFYADLLEQQGGFIRTHKKFLVNTHHIEKYDPVEDSVWLTNGQRLSFSRRKGKVLLDFFKRISTSGR